MNDPLVFEQLNHGWNAEPNAPEERVEIAGADLLLRFAVNPYLYPAFSETDVGVLRFVDCARYRLGETNDEGWYRGQCRYGRSAPGWGEFYAVRGADALRDQWQDWTELQPARAGLQHFLFYLRDTTFECLATGWCFDPADDNALYRLRETLRTPAAG